MSSPSTTPSILQKAPPASAAQHDLDAHIAQLELEIVDLKRTRNEHSPISRLPAEILCDILLFVSTVPKARDSTTPSQLRNRRFIQTLCHVSYSWRSIALGCASLWADIDIRTTTSEAKLDFLFEHGRSHPLSIYAEEDALNAYLPERGMGSLKGIKRAISTPGLSFQQLAVKGKRRFLTDYLSIYPSCPTLEIIQVFNSLIGFGVWWPTTQPTDISPDVALFAQETPLLSVLHVVGCTLPLTSPVLLSPRLTCITLCIPQGGSPGEVLNCLRHTPLLQSIHLNFRHGLPSPNSDSQHPEVEVDLPQLTRLVLAGDSAYALAILSHFKLSARDFLVALACIPPRSADSRQVGDELLMAVGKARLPSVRAWGPNASQPFSPKALEMTTVRKHIPPVTAEAHFLRITADYWNDLSTKDQRLSRTIMEIQLFDRVKVCPIIYGKWFPLLLPLIRPDDIVQKIGWSLSDLTSIKVYILRPPHKTFWPFLSKLPNLQHITLAPEELSPLAPFLSQTTGDSGNPCSIAESNLLLFPSLRHLVITRQHPSHNLEDLVKPLIEALGLRRDFAMSRGEVLDGVLESLSVMGSRGGTQSSAYFFDGIPRTLIKNVRYS